MAQAYCYIVSRISHFFEQPQEIFSALLHPLFLFQINAPTMPTKNLNFLFVSLFLFVCLNQGMAQQNLYQDSRSNIGLTAGTLSGFDGRLYLSERWMATLRAGYFAERQSLGGSIMLGCSWPTGAFKKNRLHAGLGYISNTTDTLDFVRPIGQLGYRFQFGQSPLFLYAEWTPWLDEDYAFRPLAGQATLALSFKRAESRSRKRGEPLNGIYNTAIGVKVGTAVGISSRIFTAPRGALQLELDYDLVNETFDFTITYGYNQTLGNFGLLTYANIGGGYQLIVKEDSNGNPQADLAGFVATIFGLEYNIFALPLQLGVQWEPRYSIEQGLRVELGSMALRYTF